MCARRSERGAVCIYSPGAADDRESQGEASQDGELALRDYTSLRLLLPDKSHYVVHPVFEPWNFAVEVLNLHLIVQQTTGKAKERRLQMANLLWGEFPSFLTIMQDHTNHIMMCTLCWNHEILNLKCWIFTCKEFPKKSSLNCIKFMVSHSGQH